MSVPRTPMTRGGYEKLKEELERLKRVERHAITRAIAEARAHGDLSENAEYHAAREKQSFIEGRINELETKVGAAEVIDPPTSGSRITFASTVKLGTRRARNTGTGSWAPTSRSRRRAGSPSSRHWPARSSARTWATGSPPSCRTERRPSRSSKPISPGRSSHAPRGGRRHQAVLRRGWPGVTAHLRARVRR